MILGRTALLTSVVTLAGLACGPPRLAGTLRIYDPRAGVMVEGPFDALCCDVFESTRAAEAEND